MRLIIFLSLVFLGNISAASAQTNATHPEIFALMDPGDQENNFNRFLAMDSVDGIAVRLGWKEIEQQDNHYNWDQLDSAFASAKHYGKHLTIHIAASPLGATSDWIFQQGAESYTLANPFNRRTSLEPLPWDKVYLEKWAEFLKALSAHVRENGQLETLSYISSTVPVTEMSLIGCRNNDLMGQPYSRETYLKAWHFTLKVLNKYFPEKTKLVSAPVSQICIPDNDGKDFFENVLTKTTSKNFMIFAADLNAQGSDRLNNLGSDLQNQRIGIQFIWSYTVDPRNRFEGSLQDAVCKGTESYNASYFEFYKQDLLNRDVAVQSVITNLHHFGRCKH